MVATMEPTSTATRRIRALIVDDSRVTRKQIMKALNETGLARFHFTEADDGEDALALYDPERTQVIFVDMNMERMDGLPFVRAMNAKYDRCPPTVVITGETSRELLAEALGEPGVDALMLKPVDAERLRDGLQRIIASIPEPTAVCPVPHGECVAEALKDVLATTTGLRLRTVEREAIDTQGRIVLGMIAISGAVPWSVVVGFARPSAVQVAAKLVGAEPNADAIDVGDAVGEVTNMVGGRIKMMLLGKGLTVDTHFPTVVAATDFECLTRRKGTTHSVYFDSEVGPIWAAVTAGIHADIVL